MANSKDERIRALEKTLKQAEIALRELPEQMAAIQRSIDHWRKVRSETTNSLRQMTRVDQPLQVTDHAVVRYMERAMGVDIESIRRDMRNKMYASNGRITTDGVTFIAKDNAIVTVINKNQQ